MLCMLLNREMKTPFHHHQYSICIIKVSLVNDGNNKGETIMIVSYSTGTCSET